MIVGVDVSSKRIDLAWLENNRPQRWHQELAKGHLIDRLRSIDIRWPGRSDYGYTPTPFDVTDVAIEYPYAPQRTAIAALMATTGIITRQAPPWARVAWPSSGELRAAIGAKNTKNAAHWALSANFALHDAIEHWDEHSLDALVAAVGWAANLQAQDDAA